MTIQEIHSVFLKSKGVCTDTRTLQAGQLFFALKGDNFNGNKYVKQALEAGASFAIVDEEEFLVKGESVLVKNVLETLQALAQYHRQVLKTPIIAITGSNGKTTTKELMRSVLLQKYVCFATKGNLNNHIGVPLSLLSLTPEHELAIIEMGANHQGEIASYCKWVLPEYGLITNIGKAHLEGFGGLEGVKKGKTELFQNVASRNGLVFYNGDDTILTEQSKLLDRRLAYGEFNTPKYKYRLVENNEFIALEVDGIHIQSRLIGKYNGANMAAALAVGQYFKVPLAKIKIALEAYTPQNNRSQIIKYGTNEVILDAYNANPTSMMAALEYFENNDAKNKGVFLGDMLEVGESSEAEHQLIVDYLAKGSFGFYVLVGERFYACKNEDGLFFKTSEEAKLWLKSQELNGFSFLLKGSRSMKMEAIIANK